MHETNDCSYCGLPVDEDNDQLWYSTPFSTDHYVCVPLSEKRAS